ncbi:hypothetical protein AJ87_19710 [Rhizobium yanglingense]|nr:hypothetical protein AJ87_19710 [Rhizobium yanglingense]
MKSAFGTVPNMFKAVAARRGVGSRLFEVTRTAAVGAGVEKIEALSSDTNLEGQAYYDIPRSVNRRGPMSILEKWSETLAACRLATTEIKKHFAKTRPVP